VSILTHAQTDTATIDNEIDSLINNLTALHDMACSFPAGVTLPVEKHAAFDTLFDIVTTQFEHVACSLEVAGIPADAVLS